MIHTALRNPSLSTTLRFVSFRVKITEISTVCYLTSNLRLFLGRTPIRCIFFATYFWFQPFHYCFNECIWFLLHRTWIQFGFSIIFNISVSFFSLAWLIFFACSYDLYNKSKLHIQINCRKINNRNYDIRSALPNKIKIFGRAFIESMNFFFKCMRTYVVTMWYSFLSLHPWILSRQSLFCANLWSNHNYPTTHNQNEVLTAVYWRAYSTLYSHTTFILFLSSSACVSVCACVFFIRHFQFCIHNQCGKSGLVFWPIPCII